MEAYMNKKIGLYVISIWLIICSQIVYGQRYFEGRPEEPTFPVTSLRIRGLGDDFLGIISDMESDILINPSLLPSLKSNMASLIYLPYQYSYYMNANAIVSSFLFPNTFIPKLSLGFHNQLVFSSYGYFGKYGYISDDNRFYYQQYDFSSYQQSIFLAFALSPTFRIAPFWTFAKIPYKEESGSEEEYYRFENNDTTYVAQRTSKSQLIDKYAYHQFGLGTSYDIDDNSFQFVGSWKKGNSDIKSNFMREDYWMNSDSYYWTYDSSYRYSFRLSRDLRSDTALTNLSGNIEAINVGLRWQKEIADDKKFNARLDFNKSSFDLSGNEFDSSSNLRYDSTYNRWRNYPDDETTSTEAVTSYTRYTKSLALSGQGDVFNVRFGLGYMSPLTKNLKGFVGIKSLFGTGRDSILKQGLEITNTVTFPTIIIPKQVFDTTCDTNQILTFEVTYRKRLNVSLPLGLEYNIFPPLTIRGGITTKVSYEKSGLKNEWKEFPEVVNKGINFYYSFGLGLKLGKRFSLDGYNAGNIFTVRDWVAQIRYKF